MGSIFKKFGLGILYIFVLPVYLLAVVIFGIYGVGLFLVLMTKSIILFFKGKSLHDDLPEDIEAKRILHPETVQPKTVPIIEEREETIIVPREEEVHPRALTEEEHPTEIEERRELLREEEPEGIEYSPEEDEEYEDIFEEDDNIEEATIDDLDEEEIEEEEDIPTLEDDSKISASDDDDDDDSSSGVSFTDWRGR